MFSRIFRKKRRPESEAVIDLGRLNAFRERKESVEAASASSMMDPTSTDFLGTLATAASENSNAGSTSSTSRITSTDTERVEQVSRRLERALERIDLLEHKITRIEHRTDLRY